jgi:hypothetical protein
MRISWAVALFSSAILFSGCTATPVLTSSSTTPVSGTSLSGIVHGGQNPIVGSHLYMYAVNITGYGGPGIAASSSNAAISLLASAANTTEDGSGNYYVTTDSQGAFSITGDYTCPGTASQVYLYAVGGNSGAGTNSAVGLLAALGTCPANGTLSSSLYVVVNEVSTVATAYSFAGYATDATHVSSSGSTLAATGVANAFATIGNLETLSTGVALATTPAPAASGAVPQSEINTLANILAACINSTGPTSTACATLFSNAQNNGSEPADTATAAINLAHNPGANIANLYALQTASAPFQPALTTAPNDFTVAVSYVGGGLDYPLRIAIDASGNVWVTNEAVFSSSLSEFSNTGAPLSGQGYTGGGLYEPFGLAIESPGNVWLSNTGVNSLSEFNSSGTPISGSSGYTGGGLGYPDSLAIDSSGNVWAANPLAVGSSYDISEFNSSGTAISGVNGYSGGGLDSSRGIAIDASGNIWVANSVGNSLSEFNSSGTPISGSSGYTGGGLDEPSIVVIDASGSIWATNFDIAISEFSSTGTAISGSRGFTGGGLDEPTGIAIDGSGNVWVADAANYLDRSVTQISEFNSIGTAISVANGYEGGPGPDYTTASIAIDGSGNVWVLSTDGNDIVEFVGAGSPVVTPIVANLRAPYGSHAVNKP